jgi:hypothetical protein
LRGTSSNIRIERNLVGRNAAGTAALPNTSVGIQVGGTAQVGPDYDSKGLSSSGNNTDLAAILANGLQRVITLTPDFEGVIEGDESTAFTLVPGQLAGNAWFVGSPAEGMMTIMDFVDAVFKDSREIAPCA